MATVLVLFGGTSSEHEVSLRSAEAVINMTDKEKHRLIRVGITKDGRWLMTEATPAEIASGAWERHPANCRAVLSPDRGDHGVLVRKEGEWKCLRVDCVWPVLHGKYGEDGTVQGLCELAGIPYVGPDVCASAVAMDKSQTKILVETTGVRQADYYLLRQAAYERDAEGEMEAICSHFGGKFPLFVKPCSAGSSVGVTKVAGREGLQEALDLALIHDCKVLVETAIVGREVEVAVLGNGDPKASVVGEVLSANEFYDYSAKYINAASRTVIPAEMTAEEQQRLREAAVTVYSVVGCKGMSRVDFFLPADGIPVFNEINTLPGFTSISMYPKLWEATGVDNRELTDTLIALAME